MRQAHTRPFLHVLIVAALALTATVALSSTADAEARAATRVAGPDRYATAVAVSRASWPNGADVAFLAAAGEFADALSVGAVAANRGPVLLADRDRLPQATADELRRLQPSALVVVGGTRAISDGVLRAAARHARATGRVAGPDRYATSVEVARTFETSGGTVYVANGGSYQTAIVGSTAAGAAGGPLLLVTGSGVPPVVERYLAEAAPERIVVVGDRGAVSDAVVNRLGRYAPVTRLAGENHAATAAAASRSVHGRSRHVLIATQDAFPDALTGSAYAATLGVPLLFVRPDRVPLATACEVGRLGATRITVLGGTKAVNAKVVDQLRTGAAVTDAAACDRLFVPVDGAPLHEGVFDPSGSRLYVVNHQQNQVEVVDAASGAHLRSIWVGSDPVDLDITKDGRYLYVTHLGSHDVLVVDVSTGAWVGPRIRLPRDVVQGSVSRAFTLVIDARDRVLMTDTEFGSESGGPLWSLRHSTWLDAHRRWAAGSADDGAYIEPTEVGAGFEPEDGSTASRLVRSADRSVAGLVVEMEPDTSECDDLPTEDEVAGDPEVYTKEDCLADKAKESQSGAGTRLVLWDAARERFSSYAHAWGEQVSNVAFDPTGAWAIVHGDGETSFVVDVAAALGETLALRGTVTSSAGPEGVALRHDRHGCLVAWRLIDGADERAVLEVLQIHQYDPNVGRCRDRYMPARDAAGKPLVVTLDDDMAPDSPRLNEVDLTRAQLVLGPGGASLAAMTANGIQLLAPPLP